MDLATLFWCPALNPVSPQPEASKSASGSDSQVTPVSRARTSLRQALNRYSAYLRSAKSRPNGTTQEALRQDIERLSTTLNKLENNIVRIAVFGLVSRGKSAVLNALIGQKVLPTGPLNGVTQEPRSLFWVPGWEGTGGGSSLSVFAANDRMQIELIDTPGLDEIDGQTRAKMAREISRQSDLILFIVSGDITRTEYQALCELRQAQKPLLLVFNKIDLYPDQTRQAIYENLQRLAAQTQTGDSLQQLLSANEIVLVAADPAPFQVRVEHPDGSVSFEWEAPALQIDSLKQKILDILNREGRILLALNALFQARDAELTLANKILELRDAEAEALIWKFVRYKAIAVAINPIAVLDMFGGFVSDLAMIRALSELYGLPVTRHEAGALWKTILLSSSGLLVSELGSGLVLGLGKSAAVAGAGVDSASSFSVYAGTAAFQAGIAGYGTYAVGRAIQQYLERGCSWGPQGASTVIEEILGQLEPNMIIFRLRQELGL